MVNYLQTSQIGFSENEIVFNVSVVSYIILFYIFRIVQLFYQPQRKQKQNKLTMMPLFIVCVYLISVLLDTLVLYLKQEYKSFIMAFFFGTDSLIWSLLIFSICFEWNIISSIVKFQADKTLGEMGVKKSFYKHKVERYLIRQLQCLCILSLCWHLAFVIYVSIESKKQEIEIFELLQINANIYFGLMTLYTSYCFGMLIYQTSNKSLESYKKFKSKFITRAIVLYLSFARQFDLANTPIGTCLLGSAKVC